MLCPLNSKPRLVQTKEKLQTPQTSVKAYLLQSVDKQTLVAVKNGTDVLWMFIRELNLLGHIFALLTYCVHSLLAWHSDSRR